MECFYCNEIMIADCYEQDGNFSMINFICPSCGTSCLVSRINGEIIDELWTNENIGLIRSVHNGN